MKSGYFLKMSAHSTVKNIVVNFPDYGQAEKIIEKLSQFPHIKIIESGFNTRNHMDMHTIGMIKYHGQNILQDTYRRLEK